MFTKPSLTLRVGIGKGVGFIVGLIGFFVLPWFWPEVPSFTRWGVLLWYTTVGAFIGVMGVYTRHPVLNLPMPWWVRAPFIGGWMNFVLVFFAHDVMSAVLVSTFGKDGLMTSPFWFVAEGVLVGLIIGYLATWLGGEGAESVLNDE